MTPKKFRKLAMSLPEATEGEHMNHPDFRVGGKIFATLCTDESWGMVKLTPELQAELIAASPDIYQPCNGAWGRNGATLVMLKEAEEGSVLRALMAAWRKTAPKSLLNDLENDTD